jgi:uncharacterized protein
VITKYYLLFIKVTVFQLVLNVNRIEDWPRVFIAPIARILRLAMVLVCSIWFGGFSAYAADDNPEDRTGFFSFLPAPSELKFPKIEIVPFWTDDLKRAKHAYSDGDFPQAQEYFQKASDDGNIIADWYLGHMYRLGRGVPRNQAVAYSYYSRVADGFDPAEPDINRLRVCVDGQLRVANYQRSGLPQANIKPNPKLAARTYLQLATTYAHPGALYALGVMSIEGEGMNKNPQQGLKWLNAAVRKHNPEAADYLSRLYEKGRVVRQDDTRALMWEMIATQSGSKEDNPAIFARAAELRFGATEEMRIEAEAQARVWTEENPAPPAE